MTDEEYLARLGLLRLQSGKRKPQEPVPAGSSVLDVPVGGTRRIPDTVLRRPAQPEDTITGLPEPSMAQRHAESLAGYLTPKVGGPRARAIAQTALGGDESALPFGIGLQELVPFSPYVAEEAGRMVRSGVETGSPLEIGLGLGLGALQASPAAKPIARGAKAVGKRVAEAADPENIRQYVRQTQGLTGMPGTAVIKPKGGNWLEGSVEKGTESLKSMTNWQIDNDINSSKAKIASMENAGNVGYSLDLERRTLKNLEDERKLNNWIDKKLNKYIRNEMATPEDPVRKLAEQNILHIDPEQVGINRYRAPEKRNIYGGQQLGVSDAAKAWEDATDVAINAPKAGDIKYPSLLENNPWLAKVDPEQRVYALNTPASHAQEVEGLGFDHLIDELHNATHPNSDLPAHLRWKPEDLDKVTMEQAVKRVHDINEYRAAKKAEANEVLARNPATAPYKDYETVPGTQEPNQKGLAWKQIKAPEADLPEGIRRFQTSTTQGGIEVPGVGVIPAKWDAKTGLDWAGAERDAKKLVGKKPVEDALKYEGEVMGHCVGGYCDDVLSGRSQIFSLRDKKGEPHVTIEIKRGKPWNERSGVFYDNPELEDSWRQFSIEASSAEKGKRPSNYILRYPEWLSKNYPKLYQKYESVFQESPPEITQIKGKANRAPKEEYLPFVQDFVRSGNWSRVGDIQNTGLYRKSDFIDEFTSDQLDAVGKGEYLTMNEIKKLREGKAWKPIDTRPEFDLPDDLLPPAQNYAAGGLVQNTDALRDKLIAAGMDPEQAMMQALRMADQVEMAEGGSVKAAQDWRRKLVGGGIRGIVTRGLLGMDPPEDMTPRERDIYENMVRLSAPAQGLGVGKAIFIGAKAKTWNKSAADRFVEMEKAGVSPEKMWRETGTFRGADGKLRQEISDVGAIHRNPAQLQELGKAKKEEAKELQLRMVTPIGQKDLFPKALTEAKKPVREQVKKLKDEADELMRHSDVRGQSARFVLEHPELYKAYPELADIPVMQGVSGSGRGSLIGAGPDLQMSITQQGLRHDPKSTALHEMQHAVQALEEMAPGGSPAMAFQNPKAFEILQELRAKASTPMSFEQFVEQYGSNANNADRYQEYLKSIPQTVAGLERQLQQTAAMEYYKRLAGEAEARATQFREKMGPTQRLQEFPYSSYDVLPEDLIVRPPKGAGMGEGMQAGGLAKAAKAAATELKGKYKALPLDLPRASAMTQQEIEQIAERIARQQLGEHVRKPGDTKNLAGRSLKEAERLKKLSYSLESTKTPPLEKVVPEKKGQVRVALPGDISVADKILVEVEGLPIGALQQGGPKYGAGKMDLPDPRFWASNVGPASNLQRKIDDLAMVYETPEVLAEHMAMGSTGMNFAQHLANANLMAINSSMPHPKAVEQFNKVIRKGFFDPVSKTQVEFPDFPGVENYKASYQALKEDPELRKWFNNRMKTEDVTAPLNFPRGKDIEYAISEPELRDLEIGMTGLSVGQMQPGASLIKQSAHKTYSHDIPGLYLGRTQELLPVELAFPDASAFIKSTKRPADFTPTMQKVFPHQVVDEQYINELGEYYDKLRKIRGFNEGGVVKPEGADDFAKQVMQKIANQQVSA